MKTCTTGWWFGTFFIFPYVGNNHPNWLIFFRRVQTTNQTIMYIMSTAIICQNYILRGSPPSDTWFDIYSDIRSGTLSGIRSCDIHFGTLSGNLSEIPSDNLSDIPFGILSDISSGILSGILSGGMPSRVQTWRSGAAPLLKSRGPHPAGGEKPTCSRFHMSFEYI